MTEKLVGDAMHTGLVTCQVDTPLEEVVRLMCSADVHALVVVDAEGHARGILSHMDLMGHYGENLSERRASEVMTPQVVSVTPRYAAGRGRQADVQVPHPPPAGDRARPQRRHARGHPEHRRRDPGHPGRELGVEVGLTLC